METMEKLILGFDAYPLKKSDIFRNSEDSYAGLVKYLSRNRNAFGRLFLALNQYLKHTNKFNRIGFNIIYQPPTNLVNGTIGGSGGKIVRSQIDIRFPGLIMTENSTAAMDFVYPFRLRAQTFMTRKPEYTPHIFGIFQTFSLSVWITVALVFIAMTLIHHIILKKKYNFTKNVFHVFAVLMKQNALIKPFSLAENFLIYSWVFGAMILCLANNSVFLSFLSFPPVTKIKHLSDLALAVKKGDYHCMAHPALGTAYHLRNTQQINLRIIATDIMKNNLSNGYAVPHFIRWSKKKNLALFIVDRKATIYEGNFFYLKGPFFRRNASHNGAKKFLLQRTSKYICTQNNGIWSFI